MQLNGESKTIAESTKLQYQTQSAHSIYVWANYWPNHLLVQLISAQSVLTQPILNIVMKRKNSLGTKRL